MRPKTVETRRCWVGDEGERSDKADLSLASMGWNGNGASWISGVMDTNVNVAIRLVFELAKQ